MAKSPSIRRNFVYSVFFQVLSLITPFVTTPYLSRVLGPDGIGIQSYTASYQTYFSILAVLGTATYGAREISRARDDLYERSRLFWEIELLTVITSLACLMLWWGFVALVKEYRTIYIILSLNLLSTMFDISWFFSGMERFDLLVIRNTIVKILSIATVFIFIKKESDLVLYIVIVSLTAFLSSLSTWSYLRRMVIGIKFKELNIFRHFREALLYFIPTVASSIYLVLDKTLIGLITQNTAENGYYQQADKIIGMAKSLVFTAINSVVGVRISYLFKDNNIQEIKRRIVNSINYIMFMGIACTFGISGIAKQFVPIFFGAGYDNVVFLLYILSPIIVIVGISNCMGSHYYTPSGRRTQSTKYIVIGSIVNLVMNLVLIPKFKSYGAAIASIIAELTITILYIMHCNEYINVKLLLSIGWKKFVAGTVMCLTIYICGYLPYHGVVYILIETFMGAIIYVVMLIIMRDKWTLNMCKNTFANLVNRK